MNSISRLILFICLINLLGSGEKLAAAGQGSEFSVIRQMASGPALFQATEVNAGFVHTCAVTTVGGVQCWGGNGNGELGDGMVALSGHSFPLDVVGLKSGVKAVSGGMGHTCALMLTGGVKCWGFGDGAPIQRITPEDIPGLSAGVAAISAGTSHTCALTTVGGVKCWGGNDEGELGDGTTSFRGLPVNVKGLSSGVRAISSGRQHTCAVMETGGIKCWGMGWWGELGGGAFYTNSLIPVDVIGLPGKAGAVSAGAWHTCAVMIDGGLQCWGKNDAGQLGDGTNTNRNQPMSVVGLTSGVKAVSSSGSQNTCALTKVGEVYCWGGNGWTQLGDGTGNMSNIPVKVLGIGSEVQMISEGDLHACALTTAGGVKCWGANFYGQVGDGTIINRSTAVDVIEPIQWFFPSVKK